MLSLLGGGIIKGIADSLFGSATEIFKAYASKEISKEEALAKLQTALLDSFKTIEVTHAQELTKTYTAFISAAKENKTLARGWAITLYSQLFILCWHQWVIPFMHWAQWAPAGAVWRSGSTVEWSYALIGGLLGMGVMGLRSGPAKLDVESFKKLINVGKK